MSKKSQNLLDHWLVSKRTLAPSDLSEESIEEVLLVYYCTNYFRQVFAGFEAICERASLQNPLFASVLSFIERSELRLLSVEFHSSFVAAFDQQIDEHSVLMMLVSLTKGKKTHGVFYTPSWLARFTVDKSLEKLDSMDSHANALTVLEPSIGSGVFLCEFIRSFAERLRTNPKHKRKTIKLFGVDLSPAAIVVAQFLITKSAIDSKVDMPISLFAGNTLTGKLRSIYQELDSSLAEKTEPQFSKCVRVNRYDLVLGNPPIASLTSSTGQFINNLLHGNIDTEAGSISYFEVNGRPLGEKKTWLHDDYVKFLRYAHWQIDRNKSGCIALVLNSGFISNLTFRGLRFQLSSSFDQIDVIDLGGDLRNNKNPADENVFGIETGVAVLILNKSNFGANADHAHFAAITGRRTEKRNWCKSTSQQRSKSVELVSPNFRFDKSPNKLESMYAKGRCVTEIFEKYWSAPVTARDHLIIDFSRERLVERIYSFIDLKKNDDEVRQEFFPKPRSSRYLQGDTRGWSLADARQQLRVTNWQERIVKCAYRPFDQRYILWMKEMIDWPRTNLIDQFTIPNNLCFVTRRQAPQQKAALVNPYNYFWMTRHVPLDGIIRSDNRGNEYCLTKFVLDPNGKPQLNFTTSFRTFLANELRMPIEQHHLVFDFLYAVANSAEYRERFCDQLSQSFPRFFFPKQLSILKSIASYGSKLSNLHSSGIKAERQFKPSQSQEPSGPPSDLDQRQVAIRCRRSSKHLPRGMGLFRWNLPSLQEASFPICECLLD